MREINILLRDGMVVVGLLFIGIVGWLMIPTKERFTARRLDQAIATLPSSSTEVQIAALIHKEGLEETSQFESVNKEPHFDSLIEDRGYNSSMLSGYYAVRVPHTSRAVIGECFTLYYFLFNKRGRLFKTFSESGYVGL